MRNSRFLDHAEQLIRRYIAAKRDLVRLMRHALAHGSIEFPSGASGDIKALRLWNTVRGRRTWGTVVTVGDVRTFLVRFVALAEQLDARHVKSRPQIV